MGIEVVLQDERHNDISEMVHDPDEVLAASLPDMADGSYSCLRFIDPYGDTIFNPMQAAVMIDEWDRLKRSFSERSAVPLWADIRKLIVRCSEEPHTYLRFVGD
jgi:hypothetical protein